MMPARRQLRQAIRRSTATLRQLPNVTHVTLGEKLVGGVPSGRIAAKVYVETKTSVPAAQRVPQEIPIRQGDGRTVGTLVTDVVQTDGVPEGFGVCSGDVLQAFDNDLGIAGVSFSKGGVGYVLTNAHVACDVAANGASGRMRWRDGGQVRPLGPVIYWSPLRQGVVATADAAVIRVDDPRSVEPLMIRNVSSALEKMDVISPRLNDYWFVANGELFRCVAAEPADGDNEANVDGVRIHYRGFWQLRLVQGRARKGLSGSLLCRTVAGRPQACGLVFGGLIPDYIWAYPFRPLYERIYASLPG